MDLDSKGLGRLQRVSDPREVWAMEAGDFTPWLAENIDDCWTAETGLPLSWQRRDDKRHSRIAVQHRPFSFDDVEARAQAVAWTADATGRMYDALDSTLRERAQVLRENRPSAGEQHHDAVEAATS